MHGRIQLHIHKVYHNCLSITGECIYLYGRVSRENFITYSYTFTHTRTFTSLHMFTLFISASLPHSLQILVTIQTSPFIYVS